MLLVCAFGMLDTLNDYISWQFEDLYNFDYRISLKNGCTEEEYNDIVKAYEGTSSKKYETKTFVFTIDENEKNKGFTSQTIRNRSFNR